jgi:hypothetical protein
LTTIRTNTFKRLILLIKLRLNIKIKYKLRLNIKIKYKLRLNINASGTVIDFNALSI